jgi:hypothetical protein
MSDKGFRIQESCDTVWVFQDVALAAKPPLMTLDDERKAWTRVCFATGLRHNLFRTTIRREGLLVAADSPPIQPFELGHLFRSVLRIPILPDRCIGGQILVGNLPQCEEAPIAHLWRGLGIGG